MHLVSTKGILWPSALLVWPPACELVAQKFCRPAHETHWIVDEQTQKNHSFSHPRFLPTSLLSNLEHSLLPLQLAKSAQKSFLKSHIFTTIEGKERLFPPFQAE